MSLTVTLYLRDPSAALGKETLRLSADALILLDYVAEGTSHAFDQAALAGRRVLLVNRDAIVAAAVETSGEG